MPYPPRHIPAYALVLTLLCGLSYWSDAQQLTASIHDAPLGQDIATLDRQILSWVKEKRQLQSYIERTRTYLSQPHIDHCRALLELREYQRQYHWIEVQQSQAERERAIRTGSDVQAANHKARIAELTYYLINNDLAIDRLSCELWQERQIFFALYGQDDHNYKKQLYPLLRRYMAYRQKLLMQRIQWQQEQIALHYGTEELQYTLAFKTSLSQMGWWQCWQMFLQKHTSTTDTTFLTALDNWFTQTQAWASYYRLAQPLIDNARAHSPLDALPQGHQWLPPLSVEESHQAVIWLVRHFSYKEIGEPRRSVRQLNIDGHQLLRNYQDNLIRYAIDGHEVSPATFFYHVWSAFAKIWATTFTPREKESMWLAWAWLWR